MANELKLYQIAQEYHELESLYGGDDLPDEVIKDTLESLTGELTDKCVSIAKFIRNVEAAAKTVNETAEAMHQRATRMNNMAERVKAYMLANMQLTGISKIECPLFVIRLQNNPETVNIAEDADIPERYMVTPPPPPPKPDKKLLKDALKGGADIPGVWLSQGQHVRIVI